MADERSRTIAEVKRSVNPPQENDELVFGAPWQARAFSLVVTLHREGLFEWNEFQSRLIDQVQSDAFEEDSAGPGAVYYQQWLAAFEQLLADKELFDDETIQARALEFARGDRDEIGRASCRERV